MSTALVIEPDSYLKDLLIKDLHTRTYCRVRSAETLDGGLEIMAQVHCDIVLFTIEQSYPPAWQIVKQIRAHAHDLIVRCPEVLVLYSHPMQPSDANKCKLMDTTCLPREFTGLVAYEALLAFARRTATKYAVTIRVEFRSGHWFLYLGASRTHIRLGLQLTKLVIILLEAAGPCSVEYLAEQLGVCRQTIKKYFDDLRRIFLAAFAEAEITTFNSFFWMDRQSGGTVCGVNARGIWV
jgi:DNA-binding NarL/FixJ family response regulator